MDAYEEDFEPTTNQLAAEAALHKRVDILQHKDTQYFSMSDMKQRIGIRVGGILAPIERKDGTFVSMEVILQKYLIEKSYREIAFYKLDKKSNHDLFKLKMRIVKNTDKGFNTYTKDRQVFIKTTANNTQGTSLEYHKVLLKKARKWFKKQGMSNE